MQSPDAAERNFAFGTADSGATGAVQSPDAAERNLAFGTADSGETGAVQSPDALDRNFAQSIGGSEPRDVAPTWIGDNAPTAEASVISSEPRDVSPTWIGDNSANAVVGAEQQSGDTDEYLPQFHTMAPASGDADSALLAGEPHDIAPAWVGDGTEAGDAAIISGEPHDIAPTDIGDNLSSSGGDLQN